MVVEEAEDMMTVIVEVVEDDMMTETGTDGGPGHVLERIEGGDLTLGTGDAREAGVTPKEEDAVEARTGPSLDPEVKHQLLINQ